MKKILVLLLLIVMFGCSVQKERIKYIPVPAEQYYKEKQKRNMVWFAAWYAIMLTATGFMLKK
jgi:uncharacterized lipoprotein YmbA